VYLELARRAAARVQASELECSRGAVLPIEARIEDFAALEATLITTPDALFRFHSGPPDDAPGLAEGPRLADGPALADGQAAHSEVRV